MAFKSPNIRSNYGLVRKYSKAFRDQIIRLIMVNYDKYGRFQEVRILSQMMISNDQSKYLFSIILVIMTRTVMFHKFIY